MRFKVEIIHKQSCSFKKLLCCVYGQVKHSAIHQLKVEISVGCVAGVHFQTTPSPALPHFSPHPRCARLLALRLENGKETSARQANNNVKVNYPW